AELEPALRELAGGSGAAAWAVAAVAVDGEPFGLLCVASADPEGFQAEDLRLLDGIARVTGLAIGSALHQVQLSELKQRLQCSVDLALDVGRSLEPAEVVGSILLHVTEGVRADRATFARVDD